LERRRRHTKEGKKKNRKWRGRKLSAAAGVAEEYIEESMKWRRRSERKKTFEASDTNSNGPPLKTYARYASGMEPERINAMDIAVKSTVLK